MAVHKIRRPLDANSSATFREGVAITSGLTLSNAFTHPYSASTSTGALNAYGVNSIVGTTDTPNYTLAGGAAGRVVKIFCINATSAAQATVTLGAGVSLYSSGSTVTTLRKITFQDANDGISLVGISATKYFVEGTIGSPTLGTT